MTACLGHNHLRPRARPHYHPFTVILARFAPIVRTFGPFVAGMGRMPQGSFALFNVVGALAWVGACCGGGYLFGNVPFVKAHFSLVILAILVLSVAPLLYQAWVGRARAPPRKRAIGPGTIPRSGSIPWHVASQQP